MLIVPVRGVELQLREFGIVLERHAFIAEVAADFVHALVHAHQQALQIQLERDAQIQILIELIVMRDERSGRRAAVQRLQDRRFHFEEIEAVEEAPQRIDDLRPLAEHFARFGIRQQIGIALA